MFQATPYVQNMNMNQNTIWYSYTLPKNWWKESQFGIRKYHIV